MSHRFTIVVFALAIGCVASCAELERLRGPSTPASSGSVMWSFDYGGDGRFERTSVQSTPEISDPMGADALFNQVTNLGANSFLLSFDIDTENSELLMSIADVQDLQRGVLRANIWKRGVNAPPDERTRVTYGDTFDLTPTYLPGKNAILYSTSRVRGQFSILQKELNGGTSLTVITNDVSVDLYPQVSPQTGELIYSQIREASYEKGTLCKRPLPTGQTSIMGDGLDARWSPDGKELLFTNRNGPGAPSHLCVRNMETGEVKEITQGAQEDITPSWSPDGKRKVFASNRSADSQGKPNYDIWMIDADGTLQPLTGSTAYDDCPRWLDSETIIFRSNRGDAWNLWSVKLSQAGG